MLHHGGPAVLRGGDGRDARLPVELRSALREYADVAETVITAGDDQEIDLLRRRGRQLAARAADALGRPVQFVDPVSGEVESIGVVRRDPTVNGAAVNGSGPRPGSASAVNGAHVALPIPAAEAAGSAPEPLPWGTGSAVAVFFAVLVALADVVLARSFAGAFGLLWVPANMLVTGGTIPSLWLAREVPFWRWPAFGAAAGLGVAWVVLLLGLLGAGA